MRVELPVFEGPLDLLLYLITKNQIDIFDIPISKITSEYLEYIDKMRTLQIEPASEFLIMATHLINIKSQMLLMEKEEIEENDPRRELVEELLYYQFFKEICDILLEKEILYRDVFPRPPLKKGDLDIEEELENLSIADLFHAMKEALSRSRETIIQQIEGEKVSVAEMIKLIVEKLDERKEMGFNELIEGMPSLLHIIASFLGILELLRWQMIKAYQKDLFSDIIIKRTDKQFTPELLEVLKEEYGENGTKKDH